MLILFFPVHQYFTPAKIGFHVAFFHPSGRFLKQNIQNCQRIAVKALLLDATF